MTMTDSDTKFDPSLDALEGLTVPFPGWQQQPQHTHTHQRGPRAALLFFSQTKCSSPTTSTTPTPASVSPFGGFMVDDNQDFDGKAPVDVQCHWSRLGGILEEYSGSGGRGGRGRGGTAGGGRGTGQPRCRSNKEYLDGLAVHCGRHPGRSADGSSVAGVVVSARRWHCGDAPPAEPAHQRPLLVERQPVARAIGGPATMMMIVMLQATLTRRCSRPTRTFGSCLEGSCPATPQCHHPRQIASPSDVLAPTDGGPSGKVRTVVAGLPHPPGRNFHWGRRGMLVVEGRHDSGVC
jgi:hypothetical protein